jgi:hypothetical protein
MYLTNWGKNLSHTIMQYNDSKEMFSGTAKRIRIIKFRISEV